MTSEQGRWSRLTAALWGEHPSGTPALTQLSLACVKALSVTRAGIALMGAGATPGSIGASDAIVEQLEELEFTLGQGPGTDVWTLGAPVLEADLLNDGPDHWTAFTSAAVDAGVRAVFSFPLRLGSARLGALTLYQDSPGALVDDASADAFVAAEVITRTILDVHAGLPEELMLATLNDDGAYQAEVHQASGMMSVQLEIGVGDALARLRARAFALDRPIGDLAADVVARRLRFDR